MAHRYVTPPNWPRPPEGWLPPQDWQPDPAWGPAPEGWQFWAEGPASQEAPGSTTPTVTKTVVVTILFGLFGLIPAYLASEKVKRTGQRSNRYWVAFGVSLIGNAVTWSLVTLAFFAFLAHNLSTGSAALSAPNSSARYADGTHSSAAAERSEASPTVNPNGTISCSYRPSSAGNPNLKDVGTPPNPQTTPTMGTSVLRMSTSQGDLALTLKRGDAPCAAASFTYLASIKFFDGSACHREINQPAFGVLQCGDPTGTGSGGPTYSFRQETTEKTTYPRGTIAMANTGQANSTGSQFFLCFADTQLPPAYTAVGTVDQAGLAVLDKIAAAGNDGSFEPSPGGGKPTIPVVIKSISVR